MMCLLTTYHTNDTMSMVSLEVMIAGKTSYEHRSHSVFSLHYHLILAVKFRRKAVNDNISIRLREIFEYVGKNHHIVNEAWNHDKDHIHVMFRAEPTTALSKLINAYKSASSRIIKSECPEIRRML